MTPHDIELKRYNDIMMQLDLIKEYALRMGNQVTEPGYESTFYNIASKLTIVIDLFRRYAEGHHEA